MGRETSTGERKKKGREKEPGNCKSITLLESKGNRGKSGGAAGEGKESKGDNREWWATRGSPKET